jgi:HK97 family phage prohead protease
LKQGDAGPAEKARQGALQEMRLRVTITTRGQDRHGDILEPGGAQVASFLKNPVVLWAHEHRSLPIGRVTSLGREGEALKAEVVFAETPFSREVYGLYASGFLKAWSVGFLPLEWEVLEDEAGRFKGYHVRSWELVELSAVPVPANPEALTEALVKGLVGEPALRKSLEAAVLQGAADEDVGAADVADRKEADGDKSREDAGRSSEISTVGLATLLAPKLLVRLRPLVRETVGREIRRRQGRLD